MGMRSSGRRAVGSSGMLGARTSALLARRSLSSPPAALPGLTTMCTQVGVKTLSGRSIPRDPLQSAEGWNKFTAGFAVGGLSGAAWGYICTQILPYYS